MTKDEEDRGSDPNRNLSARLLLLHQNSFLQPPPAVATHPPFKILSHAPPDHRVAAHGPGSSSSSSTVYKTLLARLSPTPSQTDSDVSDSPPRHSSTTATTTTTTTAVLSRSHSSSSRSWKRSSRSSLKEHNSSSKRSTEPAAADDEEPYSPAIASASAVSLAADPREEVDILSREVAALSTKLILAVERQADLEDSLVATKHELEVARSRVAELEEAERAYSERLEKGLLVDRKDVEHETSTLMKKLMEESRARLQAESDRRSIEQELEDLTGTLFDEANKMVASAMRRQDALEHRNKQLESVIHEKDNLLESLQEQLAALKQVLQDVTDAESQSQTPSAPSSPKSGENESSEEKR